MKQSGLRLPRSYRSKRCQFLEVVPRIKKIRSDFSGSREREPLRTSESQVTDKTRHRQSDKIRRFDCSTVNHGLSDRSRQFQSDRTDKYMIRLERVLAKIVNPKCGRTRSFLTGFHFGGI